ncbi:glutathione S-transferase family protein [Aurantiacibacter rhizosphaerae]|nr:glutathione S-transferase family protein [Aurantiacibacter rhizosphaerae]
MSHDLKLFFAYTACTRVTLTALEQVGAPYDAQLVLFEKGEHKSPDYLAVNPAGKVPCLLVDGEPLTENGAILRWLHAEYPDGGLFPAASSNWQRAQQLSVLFWISASWHPYVRAVKMPMAWTTGDIAPVRERGGELISGVLDRLDEELATRRWWFGDEWSIVDTYFWWAYINSEFGGFDLSPWKHIARHRADNEALPQLQRALAKEQAAWDARKEELG